MKRIIYLMMGIMIFSCSEGEKGKKDVEDKVIIGGDAEVKVEKVLEDIMEKYGVIETGLVGAECVPPTSKIVINEFMADPFVVTDLNGEWIELYNPFGSEVNLEGWVIRDGGSDYHTIAGLVIAGGGYAVLCRNSDKALNNGVICNYKYSNFVLANSGDQIILIDGEGNEVDKVNYSSVPVGKSLSLKHPYLDNNVIGNFGESTTPYGDQSVPEPDKGTPGGKNLDVYSEVEVSECSDGNECTWDLCEAGVCKNAWKKDCCFTDKDCNDGNPCTIDSCDVAKKLCSHINKEGCCVKDEECVDDNPCNKDYCYLNECRHTTYYVVPGCCYKSDKECDDKNVCTVDKCDVVNHKCYAASKIEGCCVSNSECNDGNFCTTDFCTNNKCENIKKVDCCVVDSDCADDGDECTMEKCIFNLCRHFQIIDGDCCTYDKDCVDDGNPCTMEKCVNGHCKSNLKAQCMVDLNYYQKFDTVDDIKMIGWKVIDYGGYSEPNWKITTQGDLGPDKFVKFSWSPTQNNVKSVLVSPVIRTDNAVNENIFNPKKRITLQWDHRYRHYGGSVTLKVLLTKSGDFQDAVELWKRVVNKDEEFNIESVVLPEKFPDGTMVAAIGGKIQIGFMVETQSTYNLDAWEIDRVKVIANLPPDVVSIGKDEVVMGICDYYENPLIVKDVDAPKSPKVVHPDFYFYGSPFDKIDFVTFTEPGYNFVKEWFTNEMIFNPNCKEENAGTYKVGLVVKEGTIYEDSPLGPIGILEKLIKIKVVILLKKGYVVWSPLGVDEVSAKSVKDAIVANGRLGQILDDLSYYYNTPGKLQGLDGVFSLLGVYGRKHQIKDIEAQALKEYLDKGGKVYLEGGDFFYTDPKTLIHPYFNIEGISDGGAKVSGPTVGRNFLWGLSFNYSQSPALNSWIDKITNKKGTDTRIIMRNEGGMIYGLVVANEAAGYRTIGSSGLFAGMIEKGAGAKKDLMAKYLYFLENGWPPCSVSMQCEDFDVCTEDKCEGSICKNPLIFEGCTPCTTDKDCKDDEACSKEKGYCVLIPGVRFDSSDINKYFGSMPSLIQSKLNINPAGKIKNINIKLKINHSYRGDVRIMLEHGGNSVVLKKEDITDGGKDVYETYDIGVAVAEGSMDIYNGEGLSGEWLLIVEDTEPAMNNGKLVEWRVYSEYEQLPCSVDEECFDGNPCTNDKCENNLCKYEPKNCDDGNNCTIDKCDIKTGNCVYEVPLQCIGKCKKHSDCGLDNVCLDVDGTVCEILDTGCECKLIEGKPYYVKGVFPVNIIDNDSNGVTIKRVITQGEEDGVVKDMNVKVVTKHTAIGDLKVKLCKDSTCVLLHNKTGANEDGFYKVWDYDKVDGPGVMGDFKGIKIAGEWELNVSDTSAGDGGTIEGWTLYITATKCLKNLDCDDGNPCTIDECIGEKCSNTEITCTPVENPCQYSKCNPGNGKCELKNKINGTLCNDGKYCTIDEACNNGKCEGGVQKDCSFLNDKCLKGVCDEVMDQCKVEALADGTPCEDGDSCTGGDKCLQGVCKTGTTPVCDCKEDKDCVDDGNLCNGTKWFCNNNKKCELIDAPKECPAPVNPCKMSECIPQTGECVEKNKLNGAPCEDGLFCSVSDYCSFGVCTGGENKDCSIEADQCNEGVCDEEKDACVKKPFSDGTKCENDGLGCTKDICVGGMCKFENEVDCSSFGNDCNDGVCKNLGWGNYECISVTKPDGTLCSSDNNPCTNDLCYGGICGHLKVDYCTGKCGGQHPYDAGDNICGYEDSCVGGLSGFGMGNCTPVCNLVNCTKAYSGQIDLDIRETLPCTEHSLEIVSPFKYVENVHVKMELEHDWLADLEISLKDPDGYNELIWDNLGGSNKNFYNTFDKSFPSTSWPMCRYKGDKPSGFWKIKICDKGNENGGVLRNYKVYVKGSDTDTNPGQKCENAIVVDGKDGNQILAGDTTCAQDNLYSSCGGIGGSDRTYKFTLTEQKRVYIEVPQNLMDHIISIKKEVSGSCDTKTLYCTDMFPQGSEPEILDLNLMPGTYYLTIDTVGLNYGQYTIDLTIFTPLDDGQPCVKDIYCKSLHCQNGYCCKSGDCCPSELKPDVCPSFYQKAPVCDDASTCQGHRIDKTCINFICGSKNVDDDTSCDKTVESDKCGFYKSVYCNGEIEQIKPLCPTYCLNDDICDSNAHCDPPVATDPDIPQPDKMTCQEDLPDGSPSNENSDCVSAHSQNGYCCEKGDCCSGKPDVCPSSYELSPVCDSTADCQGHRIDKICVNYICGSSIFQDDSGCKKDMLSDNCGLFIPVYCNGNVEQTKPECLTSCLENGVENDNLCDDIAHCDPVPDTSNSICQADLPDGNPCNEKTDCVSDHCQNNFCCKYGDCCSQPLDCPFSYTKPSVCDNAATCQGHRVDRICVNYICGSEDVDDDKGCTKDVLSDECGYYIAVYCNGEQNQIDPPCLTSCLVLGKEDDLKCDPNAHCDPDINNLNNSICLPDLPNDEPCDENSDCVSDFCQIHFCCDIGACCKGCIPVKDIPIFCSGGSVSGDIGDGKKMQSVVGQSSIIEKTSDGTNTAEWGFYYNPALQFVK